MQRYIGPLLLRLIGGVRLPPFADAAFVPQVVTQLHEGSRGQYDNASVILPLPRRVPVSAAPDLVTDVPAPTEWRDVLESILPPQGCWSEELYLVLTDHANRLIEYTDGFLEILPWPTDGHQSILGFLLLAFHQFLVPRGGKVLFAPLRLRIRPGKFREPDLLLLLSATDPRRQNRFWQGADLALEVVSEDKPERDLVDKRHDYAEGRVPEYWIVNPMTETITVLQMQGDAYVEAGTYHRGQTAVSVLLPEFAVSVDQVFDAD
jgi:Uma2 family endonuclease